MNKGMITIGIVDTGLDIKHPLLKGIKAEGISIELSGKGLIISGNYQDTIGHGTAVCGIIYRLYPDAEFKIFKLFKDSYEIEEETFCKTLEYIDEHYSCNIINLSLGTLKHSSALEKICKKMYLTGTMIVAAFDNMGAISFPAAYPFVIGVDSSRELVKSDDFILVKNDPVSIVAKGGIHRVAWLNGTYSISMGTSFSAPYVTAYIARSLSEGIKHNQIIEKLSSISKRVYVCPEKNYVNGFNYKIKRAVIFPYSKEIKALINFYDLLDFEIVDICDIHESGKIGKNVNNIDNRIVEVS